MKTLSLMLMVGVLSSQGCIVAGIGAGMYGARSGAAKKTEAATDAKSKYAMYRVEMEKLNFEREKASLAQKDIMTFDQWNMKPEEK